MHPSISFLTKYVLPFSKRQAVLLLAFEYTYFNIFSNWRCPSLFETTSAAAIRIWIIVFQSLSYLLMSSPFRNYKRCRYSYLNNSPIISFQTEDVLPYFETTSAATICIWIIVPQSLFQLKMSCPFRNDKRCRYSYLNNSPLISFQTEDVLPFSKQQALSLFVFE